jgi:hypothetical protein
MRTAGFLLLGLGATSFLFPLIGRRSMIMGVFGPYEKYAAIGFLVAGAVVFAVSFLRHKEDKKPS